MACSDTVFFSKTTEKFPHPVFVELPKDALCPLATGHFQPCMGGRNNRYFCDRCQKNGHFHQPSYFSGVTLNALLQLPE